MHYISFLRTQLAVGTTGQSSNQLINDLEKIKQFVEQNPNILNDEPL
jgi:hypothetical protein